MGLALIIANWKAAFGLILGVAAAVIALAAVPAASSYFPPSLAKTAPADGLP
jgi:hypothetical protein